MTDFPIELQLVPLLVVDTWKSITIVRQCDFGESVRYTYGKYVRAQWCEICGNSFCRLWLLFAITIVEC